VQGKGWENDLPGPRFIYLHRGGFSVAEMVICRVAEGGSAVAEMVICRVVEGGSAEAEALGANLGKV